MKAIASIFEGLVKHQVRCDVRLYLLIHENWEHIVGKKLSAISSFNGVKKGGTGNFVANVSVVSSGIVQIKEKEQKIINAIYAFSNGKYRVDTVCWRHTIIDFA